MAAISCQTAAEAVLPGHVVDIQHPDWSTLPQISKDNVIPRNQLRANRRAIVIDDVITRDVVLVHHRPI